MIKIFAEYNPHRKRLAIDEPLEYAQLYLDGFSFHLTAPYSEERREAAWEYAREHDAADRLK